jgi:hypothetical protein
MENYSNYNKATKKMDLLQDNPLNPGNILSNFCYSIQNFMVEEEIESIDIIAIKMLYKKELKKLVNDIVEYKQDTIHQELLLRAAQEILNDKSDDK